MLPLVYFSYCNHNGHGRCGICRRTKHQLVKKCNIAVKPGLRRMLSFHCYYILLYKISFQVLDGLK